MCMKKELFLIVGHCNVEQEFNSDFKKISRKKRSKIPVLKSHSDYDWGSGLTRQADYIVGQL